MLKNGAASVFLLVWLGLSGSAWALGYKTGNGFLAACRDESANTIEAQALGITCAAFVNGLVHGMAGVHSLEMIMGLDSFCLPDAATIEQLKDLTRKYVVAHPERRHEPITILAEDAFREAFPCKRQPEGEADPP